jgi:uncharacterized protein DUF5980
MDGKRARVRVAAVLLASLLGSIASVTTSAAAGAAPIGGAARRATWHLEDYRQSGCFSANVHDTYYGIYIDGRWRNPINVGADHLPLGGSYDTSYAPIPPGSSNGEFSLAYVHVTLSPNPPNGRYVASMWANDGSVQQRVPIVLEVRSRCGY